METDGADLQQNQKLQISNDNPNKIPLLSTNRTNFAIILGVIFAALTIGIGVYYWQTNKSKTTFQNNPNSPSLSDTWRNINPSPTQTILIATLSPSEENTELFTYNLTTVAYRGEVNSGDGKYYFSLILDDDSYYSNKCKYNLIDKANNKPVLSPILPPYIACFYGEATTSTFITLGNDGKLVVGGKPGEVIIYDFINNTQEKVKFDSKTLILSAINSRLNVWLYLKNDNNSNYVIMDKNNNTLKEFSFPKNENEYIPSAVLNDLVNEGFVFITASNKPIPTSSTEGDSLQSYKLEFLSLNDLQIRTLLTTSYGPVSGRGCSGDGISSIKGEIIISPGCILVDKSYLSTDNKIHIKL